MVIRPITMAVPADISVRQAGIIAVAPRIITMAGAVIIAGIKMPAVKKLILHRRDIFFPHNATGEPRIFSLQRCKREFVTFAVGVVIDRLEESIDPQP